MEGRLKAITRGVEFGAKPKLTKNGLDSFGWQRQVCHRAFLPKMGPQFGKNGDEGWGTVDFFVFAGHHLFFLAGR
ncbi:hypothetical protein [Desulfuromonas sp. TF]|uniref:hypothetical protein n=1 Tax=Desulfuromonas sp. TF TaxID=1232410 RepID=UPI000428B907|nr:hypothetical protein [Desulfuromonas sp. TF]